ncbi:MAG: hypothetical protein KC620_14140, partial [Myxococcales bacterium]|nr:hypothetical protein [Myxococcales bacterium]
MRLLPCCFLAALTLACVEGADPPPSARPVPGAPGLRVAPDPGPPPLEQPPRATLWQREGDGWRALGRVTAVAPG